MVFIVSLLAESFSLALPCHKGDKPWGKFTLAFALVPSIVSIIHHTTVILSTNYHLSPFLRIHIWEWRWGSILSVSNIGSTSLEPFKNYC